jgi:hypothetical protein
MNFDLSSQTFDDALRSQQSQRLNTARVVGMGGAFGAVGADIGGISINPASLAQYKRNDIVGSLAFENSSVRSTYNGVGSSDNSFRFNIPSLGLVFANEKFKDNKPKEKGLKFLNIGIGFNRTQSFNMNRVFEADVENQSITDALVDDANTQRNPTPDGLIPFSYAELGYLTGLIGYVENEGIYKSILDYESTPSYALNHYESQTHRGSMNQIYVSAAGNYSDKFYIGATLNIETYSYRFSRTFEEFFLEDNAQFYNFSEFSQSLRTSGVGISARFGAIYAPSFTTRVGVSVQTPTAYALSDEFTETLRGVTFDLGVLEESFTSNYSYTSILAPKIVVSGMHIFTQNKKPIMLIAIDIENQNYANAKYSSKDYNYREENNDINEILKSTTQLRVGLEKPIGNYRIRAGYSYESSPLKKEYRANSNERVRQNFSIGWGYKSLGSYVDLGLNYSRQLSQYIPYVSYSNPSPEAKNTIGVTTLLITTGTWF